MCIVHTHDHLFTCWCQDFVYLTLHFPVFSCINLPAWAEQELDNNGAKKDTWAAKAMAQKARLAAGNGKKLQLMLCEGKHGLPMSTTFSVLMLIPPLLLCCPASDASAVTCATEVGSRPFYLRPFCLSLYSRGRGRAELKHTGYHVTPSILISTPSSFPLIALPLSLAPPQ